MSRIIPFILCGGSGTRLWPLSRKDFAKQHLPILDGESPFQRTLSRLAAGGFDTPVVIAGAGSRFMVADQAADAGATIELVLEPEGRDTAPAVALAAEIAYRRDAEAVALVLPSDHLVSDAAAFAAAVEIAARAADCSGVVTFGVVPSGPASAYGYIRPGPATPCGGRQVVSFEEKPDADRAAELISAGCLWNSGMFCFRADTGRALIHRLAPDVAAAAARGLDAAEDDLGALRIGQAFAEAPKVSFDYAVMERTEEAVVIAADFTWSDIGNWREIWAQAKKDTHGNALDGAAVVHDARNTYVHANAGRLVCALGVDDLAVVDTPDALLVAPLDRAEEVKDLVASLGARGRREATTPARVYRPWGWFQTMDLGERFRVKRIRILPGRRLSLQKHMHRAEHWVVVRGTAEVSRDGETMLVSENESIYLPIGCVHRLANPGRVPVDIVEIQTGAYLEEDDIVRIEDDFARC